MNNPSRFPHPFRIAVFTVVLTTLATVGAASTLPRNVLVLHSYHPGYPWTERVMAGIQEIFDSSGQNIRLHVEYLDTKRHPNPEYFSNILDAILHYKLEGRSFDLVLLTHNEALNFALAHRHDLFAGTPLVFSAVTGFEAEAAISTDDLTGVIEIPDFEGILRLAQRLDPALEKIVIVGSTLDLSGRLEERLMRTAVSRHEDRMRVVFWNDLPAELLAERLLGLHRKAAVILLGTVADRGGNILSIGETCRLVRENTSAPLYALWDPYLGEGIVGGRLVDLTEQGRHAAGLALQILAGHEAEKLPIISLPPTPPVFDYRELQRLGISQVRLPAGSSLVHQPPGFYRLSKRQVTFLLGVLATSVTLSGVLSRNILQRRKAEARLRESEQRYRQLSQQFQIILDGIPDGVTLISQEMKVVWSNKGAGGYSGAIPGSGTPGEYCCKVLYNRAELCDGCPAVEAFRTGRGAEATVRTPDGRELEVKAFPLRNDQGKVTHAILLAGDVTEKNKLREEAERASRLASLGELAAGIAHEINNPNALILLNASLVRRSCADAAPILMEHYRERGDFPLGGLMYSEMSRELPHLFSEMLEGAERIRRIVADLKDFARPETSEMDSVIDLNEVVMAAVRLVGNAIKQATDHFAATYDPDLPRFRGNFQKVEQVAVNLLMNACQALPDRERAITIETGAAPDRRQIWLRISDQGVGIAAEDLSHVTDPFFTTKREQGGTGLGLSVSSRIVRDHGGRLEFISAAGEGTTVLLHLPAAQHQFHPEGIDERSDNNCSPFAYSAGR